MVLNVPTPELKLQELDARTLAEFLSAAADLTIVVDGEGVIVEVSQTLRDTAAAALARWRGRQVEDVVRPEHHDALRAMLAATRSGKPSRRLDLTHPLDNDRDLPVQYSAFRLDGEGKVILVGRDLRAVAELQSQLLDNRQSLEQNSRRQRQAEAHYRLLFETAAEAMVIVDPDSGKVREANPRAVALLATSSSDLVGRKFAAVFAKPRQAEVQSALAQVLSSGRKVVLVADAGAATKAPLDFGFELFRAGDLKLVLVRMAGSPRGEQRRDAVDESLGDLVRSATEAILLSDDEGRVLWVNEAFLAIAGLPLAANAVGRRLDAFFRWNGIEEGVLLANIRRHGRVPTFAAIVRGANGQTTEVDLSAVVRSEGTQPGFGFVMRVRAGDELRSSARGNSDLTRTAESLADMVGRVPMKDMVRDTTDVIERMCIEAALKLTGNNRASAARILGLSRQALYLKMNRFGIADDGLADDGRE